jgi:hypothetical protein
MRTYQTHLSLNEICWIRTRSESIFRPIAPIRKVMRGVTRALDEIHKMKISSVNGYESSLSTYYRKRVTELHDIASFEMSKILQFKMLK